MNQIPGNKPLLDATADNIYNIIESRDVEAHKLLLSLICATIEAIAEQYEYMPASELAYKVYESVKKEEEKSKGGDH